MLKPLGLSQNSEFSESLKNNLQALETLRKFLKLLIRLENLHSVEASEGV